LVDFNLSSLAKRNVELKEKPSENTANDRHMSMLAAIAPYAKKVDQKNVTPVYINYKKRNTKLALVLCPQWAAQFPPFNLARLSGVAKTAGYETHILDLNVKAYNQFQKESGYLYNHNTSLWDPSVHWKWREGRYLEDVHPYLDNILQEAIDKIIEFNPQAVGFTVYDVNEEPTKWMCRELKKKLPNIKILVGGSNVQKSWFERHPYYDYVVNGEGEYALLQILDEIENGIVHDTTQYITQPEDQRLNLNGFPMPDYESINFSDYSIPNGVNTEISRGCIAKCTFCEETHFWKYRQRSSVDLITEIEWLYYNKGTDVIWFIDSLVNGNINELRAFCKAVQTKGLNINWTGYARCDGRMDLDYFKDLKAGGCIMLNYGVESGSQKVLDDMDKKVKISEIEQNFKDGKEVGIFNATNWIVGFPTEKYQDFADTLTLLWRLRNLNMNNIGIGGGFGLSSEAIVGQNLNRFNISDHFYQGHWITKDFSMGGTHVMVRLKTAHIFLDIMKDCTEKPISYPPRTELARSHYKIKFNNPSIINEIEFENFDYNIIKPNINSFADSLMNEVWPLLRILWKTRGAFEIEIKYNPDIDLKEFGNQYDPGMLNAIYKFIIDDNGKWFADFDVTLNQIENPFDNRRDHRRGPFYAQDYTRIKSNTAIRARKLAKPKYDLENGRTEQEFAFLMNEEKIFNKTIDFSFKYHYCNEGNW